MCQNAMCCTIALWSLLCGCGGGELYGCSGLTISHPPCTCNVLLSQFNSVVFCQLNTIHLYWLYTTFISSRPLKIEFIKQINLFAQKITVHGTVSKHFGCITTLMWHIDVSANTHALFPRSKMICEVIGWAEWAPKAWCDTMWIQGMATQNYFLNFLQNCAF